jgi:hypothetical protein
MADTRAASSQRKSKERRPGATLDTETLIFKVTTEFKKQFKGYA